MADKTTGKLSLWLTQMTDKISDTINTYLPENFTKIDTGFSALKDDVDAHKAENVTQGDNPHGIEYEEGTWTPAFGCSVTAGSNTYNKQNGRYILDGNKVTLVFEVEMSALDENAEGAFYIAGLPFSVGHSFTALSVGYCKGITFNNGGRTQLSGVATSSSDILLRSHGSGLNSDTIQTSRNEMADNGTIIGTFTYFTN